VERKIRAPQGDRSYRAPDLRKARLDVSGSRRLQVILVGGILFLSHGFDSAARAQAIAYIPGIGFIPSGATMTVTPVVSPDRRYVRLGVDAFFNNLNSLQTFSFPGGAVSGGGGFGGFGGMNGVMGGGGGAVAGGGGAVAGGGAAMGAGAFGFNETGYAAGPVPIDGVFGEDFPPFLGDPLDPNNAAAHASARPEGDDAAGRGLPAADPAFPIAGEEQGARAAAQRVARHSKAKAGARKPSRRPTATSRRRTR
jgi:hypothetical protein